MRTCAECNNGTECTVCASSLPERTGATCECSAVGFYEDNVNS